MKVLVALLIIISTSGCMYRHNYNIVSSKDISSISSKSLHVKSSTVKGKDVYQEITPAWGIGSHELNKAIDKALATEPNAVAIANGKIRDTWFYIPLIYFIRTVSVEGQPVVVVEQ